MFEFVFCGRNICPHILVVGELWRMISSSKSLYDIWVENRRAKEPQLVFDGQVLEPVACFGLFNTKSLCELVSSLLYEVISPPCG